MDPSRRQLTEAAFVLLCVLPDCRHLRPAFTEHRAFGGAEAGFILSSALIDYPLLDCDDQCGVPPCSHPLQWSGAVLTGQGPDNTAADKTGEV